MTVSVFKKKTERRYLGSLNKISDTSPPEKAFDLPDIMVGRSEKRRRHTVERAESKGPVSRPSVSTPGLQPRVLRISRVAPSVRSTRRSPETTARLARALPSAVRHVGNRINRLRRTAQEREQVVVLQTEAHLVNLICLGKKTAKVD